MHILTPSATVRRIVNMTALAVADANAPRGSGAESLLDGNRRQRRPFPGRAARARAPGLVLTGGGARAAYQVGVVKAVRDILGNPVKNPFPIVCGTSAGAINAATLAVFADDFSRGVGNLLEVWENMQLRAHLPHRCVAHPARRRALARRR